MQQAVLPYVTTALEARSVFALLREDVRFCADVATLEQYAALRGKTVAQLSGREASWQQGGTDFVGPSFNAAWRGSPEESAEALRQKNYSEQLRKRRWGE